MVTLVITENGPLADEPYVLVINEALNLGAIAPPQITPVTASPVDSLVGAVGQLAIWVDELSEFQGLFYKTVNGGTSGWIQIL